MQEAAPGALKLPAEQVKQAVEPPPGAYRPEPHCEQPSPGCAAKEPGGPAAQPVRVAVAAPLPASHSRHERVLARALYWPAGQGRQAAPLM